MTLTWATDLEMLGKHRVILMALGGGELAYYFLAQANLGMVKISAAPSIMGQAAAGRDRALG